MGKLENFRMGKLSRNITKFVDLQMKKIRNSNRTSHRCKTSRNLFFIVEQENQKAKPQTTKTRSRAHFSSFSIKRLAGKNSTSNQ